MRPYFQTNQSKMDWKRGSSDRVPALQNPEFKPQYHQKEKKNYWDETVAQW
jgi:hypothetical protein